MKYTPISQLKLCDIRIGMSVIFRGNQHLYDNVGKVVSIDFSRRRGSIHSSISEEAYSLEVLFRGGQIVTFENRNWYQLIVEEEELEGDTLEIIVLNGFDKSLTDLYGTSKRIFKQGIKNEQKIYENFL